MLRPARRTVATAIAVALIGACASERSAPVALRPPGPVTTTSTTTNTRPDRPDPTTTDADDIVDPVDMVDATDATDTSPATESEGADVTTSTAPALPPSDAAWARFDAALSDRLLGGGDYAAGVAVAVDGEIVHTADFGYRVPPPAPTPAPEVSVEPGVSAPTTTTMVIAGDSAEPIEPGDRFRIASISKVITAIVVLQLVEAGQIRLDEPIGEVLAAVTGATIADPAMAGITVRQLLSHTSGLPEYQGTFFGGRVESCAAAAQQGLSASLAAAPGTSYRYSNLNFCLLGLLVEHVAGRPYEAVVKDRLLEPLGIEGMRLVKTFDPDPAEVVHPSAPLRNYMDVLGAAGAWVATPSDIVTIVSSLDSTTPGFHPLSPPMVELMRQPTPAIPYPRAGRWYGLGLMAFGDGSYGHSGTVEMTHAMVVDRPDGVTWSVLVSGEYPWETDDLRAVFDRSVADAGIAFG